jgi:CPA1 family monovalent cation:H+ antiporter
MNVFDVSALLLTATALGSFVNYKWIKLPSSIALLLMAMVLVLLGILLRKIGLMDNYYIKDFLSNINFEEIIFHGMLSFFLFAGALQINLEELQKVKLPIVITATISTLISTIIVGFSFYVLANYLGFTHISLLYAMLFGSILSPTDPIAVLSIIKKMNVSKKIETIIIGESLFNDGVAIVFFLTIIELINSGGGISTTGVLWSLFLTVCGGVLFGTVIGWVAYQMLLRVDNYQVELFITLAVATGGYSLAQKLNFSAPLAMVIAGLIIGNHYRSHAMSDQSKMYINAFWEAIDEVLNAVLFFLIGLEMMLINPTIIISILSFACIFFALSARFISIAIPLAILKPFHNTTRSSLITLTWGGLRGGISIAMVLSLQQVAIKDIFLPCIYIVVVFSIIVQGLTFGNIFKRYQTELQKI